MALTVVNKDVNQHINKKLEPKNLERVELNFNQVEKFNTSQFVTIKLTQGFVYVKSFLLIIKNGKIYVDINLDANYNVFVKQNSQNVLFATGKGADIVEEIKKGC